MIKSEFEPIFKLLCANPERPLSKEQLTDKRELFWIKFNNLEKNIFLKACMSWVNKSKFMPAISQIREIIDRQESRQSEPLTPEQIQQIKYKFTDKGQREIKDKFIKAWEKAKKQPQV